MGLPTDYERASAREMRGCNARSQDAAESESASRNRDSRTGRVHARAHRFFRTRSLLEDRPVDFLTAIRSGARVDGEFFAALL